MKRTVLALTVTAALSAFGCASEGYNTQKGAAIGAIGGALAGQAIGRNTAGTLIGAASGALVGAVAGNAVDQSRAEAGAHASPPVAAAPPQEEETPPGEWVDVPGEWVGGKWVPAHRAWVPRNPEGGPETEVGSGSPPSYEMAPPPMAPVPGTAVYFVPGIDVDILFYGGWWYRPYHNRWYRARGYNGPWAFVRPGVVPPPLLSLPPGYRRLPHGYRPIPQSEFQRNWRRWDRDRYWDRHRDWH